jgi:allophanate hydrolase subunit 2
MDAFSILTPGGYTTIQDKGRFGYQQMGVPISGALDAFAFRAANLLVGNLKNAAVMEITVMGPRLEIAVEADMAVTGAEIGMTLNDQPVEGWMSFRVKPGDILDIQQVKSGCRAYLAISGGIDVTEVMGSRSTYVGGKIGGFHGRVLQAGDVLKCGETKRLAAVRKTPADMIPAYPSEIVIRAIRMGYRLQGPKVELRKGMPKSIISEPTMPGGVQIPADEQPIILMVEQTVGGYTKIVTVISVDLPKVAQATPGDTIRFEKVSLETAHLLYQEQLKKLHDLEESLSRQ